MTQLCRNDGLYHPSSEGTLLKDLMDKQNQVQPGPKQRVSHGQQPEQPEQPDQPDQPEQPEQPDQPEQCKLTNLAKSSRYNTYIGHIANDDVIPTRIDNHRKKHVSFKNENNCRSVLFLPIEAIILLSIYVVMSQPFVFDFIAKYVHQLNSDGDKIPFAGIIIYGLILVMCFFVIRMFVELKLG